MMLGGYSREKLPRVIHISIARYREDLPKSGEELAFLVSIHEEGTGITWQQNVSVDRQAEQFFLEASHNLHLWSINRALTAQKANRLVEDLGKRLYEVFMGSAGEGILRAIKPTAVLIDVDETILNLPWEAIAGPDGHISQHTPFGRLVTTRTGLRMGRDPLEEDTVVRILAVANPTLDLAATEAEITTLRDLEEDRGPYRICVEVLSHEEATRKRFAELIEQGDFDILHFAGHAYLNPGDPGSSALRFADGDLAADEVLKLKWKATPYFVFNSACESGRGVSGARLVSEGSHSNGLAAAFLAIGVYGYAGYFWPVTDVGAGMFTGTFYRSLFQRENFGLAFLEARNFVLRELGEVGDLTAYSAILFGDAASKHRRDLATAV
ncbi:MAG: CHAT domain-containing protein [Acidobacteria bacterium]|nr:MAG: CHAT domain-containing protein [Acidobacteriota bacterium]